MTTKSSQVRKEIAFHLGWLVTTLLVGSLTYWLSSQETVNALLRGSFRDYVNSSSYSRKEQIILYHENGPPKDLLRIDPGGGLPLEVLSAEFTWKVAPVLLYTGVASFLTILAWVVFSVMRLSRNE